MPERHDLYALHTVFPQLRNAVVRLHHLHSNDLTLRQGELNAQPAGLAQHRKELTAGLSEP
jgi:hypothetical protein